MNTNTKAMTMGRLDDFVGLRIRLVLNKLLKEFADSSKSLHVRSGAFSALELIHANPGVSQKDISEALSMDKSAVVLLIDKIEKNGWAKRRRSTTDRRRHELICTKKGEQILDKLFEHVRESEMRVFNMLQPDEYDQLINILAKVRDSE